MSDWVKKVTSVSTFPPDGLYTKDAMTIARWMATPEVSPKGIGSAIRMVQFYINRAGHNLSIERREVLEQAKFMLQTMTFCDKKPLCTLEKGHKGRCKPLK